MMGRVMNNFTRHPEMAEAARVGEPTLVDPKPTSATQVVQEAGRVLAGGNVGGQGSGTVSVEQIKPGATPPPNQPIPRSDATDTGTAPAVGSNVPVAGSNAGGAENAATPPAGNTAAPAASTDSNASGIEDLTSSTGGSTQGPSATPQPANPASPATNGQPAKPNDSLTAPAQAPAQVNDAAGSADTSAKQANAQNAQSSNDPGSSSSSKKKKKKHKLVPF
jgi:outer membrane protein assembly factor BamD